MAQALLTAVVIGLAGLVTTAVFGLRGTDISRHISFGIFSTLVTLLAHSMMMFYLIGKGKAVKDAMAEHSVTGDYYRRIAAARKPVFSIGTLAMAVTMVAAILGASVDTGVLPPIVHAMIAYGAIACNLAALKIEIAALTASSRIVDEVNRLISARDGAVLELAGIVQGLSAGCARCGSRELRVAAGEQVAILGLDQPSAEVFVNLVDRRDAAGRRRGPRLRPPDVARSPTAPTGSRRSIASASSASARCCSTRSRSSRIWRCRSRSRSSRRRATCATRAEALAREVGLPETSWDAAGRRSSMPAGRLRVRFGRALALDPAVLLLEHVSARLPRDDVAALGARHPRRGRAGAASPLVAATADERVRARRRPTGS